MPLFDQPGPHSAKRLYPHLTLAALVFAGLLGSVAFSTEVERLTVAPDLVRFLVRPYLQLPRRSGITVMWETSHELPGQVEYGPTPEIGLIARGRPTALLHEVTLHGLQPATTYYYRVRSGELLSDVEHFKTAPPPGAGKWKMAVYGDSRSNPSTHRKIAEQIAKVGVDLIVHTGDIVLNGKNHDSWRTEFFEPLAGLAPSVPWVSTIGNHESDSANYFSYMALPGNERYFGFDYGNAHIVCLDSNAWIEKGRDSKQFAWLAEHLREQRSATWTFVVFHHPLMSGSATRAINPLRWEWTPLLIDPRNHVDGVLNGHDHFYTRCHRMARVAEQPQPGVLFLTTAGGGASLYRSKPRDYIAVEKSIHHFTLFEFDGDRVTLSAIDLTGRVFDRTVLTKEPTPAAAFCSYDVEELRQFLRLVLAAAEPVIPDPKTGRIETLLRVPTRFRVPVTGHLLWNEPIGWRLLHRDVPFEIKPGEPLTIKLEATVPAGSFAGSPKLTILFDEGKFSNRRIELYPFKIGGPLEVKARPVTTAVVVDGKLTETAWTEGDGNALLGLPPRGGRGDEVRLLATKETLYAGVRLDDPSGSVRVTPADPDVEPTRMALFSEHVRLLLSDGTKTHTFAVSPARLHYHDSSAFDRDHVKWQVPVAPGAGFWSAEFAIPRTLFPDWKEVRVNVVHQRKFGRDSYDLELTPTYSLGFDPDVLPDWKSSSSVARFARLLFE